MRMFRLAAALVAAFIFATLAPPAAMAVPVVMQPVFTLSSPSAPAGSPETFVITRVAGGAGIYLLFQTSDVTARAGVDYTATKQLIYLKGSTKTATVSVPTFINSGSAAPLKFNAVIANTATPVRATGIIVEPTQTCPDGSVIAAAGTCPAPPPPATQTCPDGTVILASAVCPPPPAPAPAPAPQWVLAPLTDGGYARCKNPNGCTNWEDPLGPPAAKFGDVYVLVKNGFVYDGHYTVTNVPNVGWVTTFTGHNAHSLWPLGQVGVPYAAIYSWIEDWEGVAPAS